MYVINHPKFSSRNCVKNVYEKRKAVHCELFEFWIQQKNHLVEIGYVLLLLLLFVFNIYVLAVVITVISSVRQVITNDQRLTKYSRLYISNTFLSILEVLNKVVFCITPTLHVMPSFPIHLPNSGETLSIQGQFLHFSISTIF